MGIVINKDTIMKRIVCITESLGGGGAEHQLVILAEMLHEKGYDVTVATFADVPDHYSLSADIKRVKIGQGRNYVGKWLSVWKYLLRAKVDCVISYRQKCNIRVLPIMIFRPKVKVLASERNLTVGKPDVFERLLVRLFYYRADAIIPNSFSQKKHLETANQKLSKKLTAIINYIDLEHYQPREFPKYNGVLKIGIFARLSAQKNFPAFAQMLSLLNEEQKNQIRVDWYANIQGDLDGYNQEYVNAKSLIAELGLDGILNILPAVKDTSEYICKYHVIALPSLFEGFSNSIGEAICSGRPMFCSDVSDNSLMVHKGENGFLFNPTSVYDMKLNFELLLNVECSELLKMGGRSRNIAEELFSKDKFIREYINIIEK